MGRRRAGCKYGMRISVHQKDLTGIVEGKMWILKGNKYCGALEKENW